MKRIALLAIVCAAAPLASQPRAAAPQSGARAFTVDDVMALRSVSDAQLSPDGRWVAYVVTTPDMKENANDADVWLVPSAGGPPVRLTTSKKSDTQPRWSPDGKRLAFISAREEKAQLFLISPFGGEAEKLTDVKTPVQAFQWSPDGTRIAFVAQQEPTPDEEKRQKEKDDAQVVDENFKFARLWVIDVGTKKATELVKSDHVSDPQWAPDGRRIAYVAVPTPKADDGSLTDIWVVEVASGKRRKLLENGGSDVAPRWSPDGRTIAFLTRERLGPLGQLRLATVEVREDGSVAETRRFAPEFLYQPGAATWSADRGTLYFTAPVRTTTQLFALTLRTGEARQITNLGGVISQVSFSQDRRMMAFTKSDLQQPADVYTAENGRGFAPRKLTDHNPQARELARGQSSVVRWRSRDGTEIEGVVILPVGFERGKRYPTVVQVHGGPAGVWTQSFPGSWGNFGHVWASNGWVVFYPNVRGSSGYGEKFLLSNIRGWGKGDFEDIQSGVDTLVALGIADPERLAQTGWSYGGYMTAWTITQTTRFKAAMVGAGLTNMFSMYSTNDLQRTLEGYFGDQPWNDEEAYRTASAMTYIKRAKTPTLIQHGAADLRVPPSQAQELYMGLRKNGVPAQLVLYPREPHGLQEPRHQLDKMRRELAWFAKHVLGVEETPRVTTSK